MTARTRNFKTATFKTVLTTTTLLAVAGFTASPALAVDDLETPMGEQVVGGSASFDRPEMGRLNINQNTNRLVINWDSFNIGKDAKTEFFQPGKNALAVNRVVSKGSDPSKILGQLKANGQVMVLDRNGVFFGKGAIIDTNGIIASTGDATNDDIMDGDGKIELTNFGDGEIINEGTISVGDAGIAAFVAPTVKNYGFINVKMGKVALAAGGEKVTLDLYGDKLVELAVDDAKGKALIENAGTIAAEGGVVTLSTNAAKDVVDEVINMDGVIEVSSVKQVGGKIILSGGESGKVTVSGSAKANGATGGGSVTVKGQDVTVTETASLEANATDNGNGGDIAILGESFAGLHGSASARGGENGGNGGFIELSSDNAFGITGMVDTTAANGARGTFLLDPRDLELRLGNRTGFDLQNLYESDIEVLSFLTDITLEARRNFTVSLGQYGAGSDGVISLANDANLTIQTTNSPVAVPFEIPFLGIINEPNNAGVINLTGNATYGANLEWKTSGTGSISILGATDNNQGSNITLSKLTTAGGDITVDTNKGSIFWAGAVNSNGGAITGSSTQGQTVARMLSSNGGNIGLDNAATSFGNIIQIASTGGMNSAGGDITIDNNGAGGGFIEHYGAINSGTGNVLFSGRQNKLFNGSTVTADELTFNGGLTTQTSGSTIVAETLKGVLSSTASFLGLNNNIANIGDFATGTANFSTGGFTLNNGGARRLNVTGAVSTTGGDIAITNANRMDVRGTGSVLSDGGNITLNATNNSFLYGDGLIDARGASSTGDVAMNAGSTVVLRTGQVFADDLSFTGKTVSQETPSTIIARNLTGSLEKAASFLGADNDIDFISDFTTGLSPFTDGGFTLHDVDGFEITGAVTSTGGDIAFDTDANSFDDIIKVASTGSVASNGGNISFDNNGSSGGFIDVYGNVNSGAGDTSFNGRQNRLFNGSKITADDLTFTGSSVNQQSGSTIIATKLKGALAATASFLGLNNDVDFIGDFATGTANWSTGGLTLHDVDGFEITGAVTSTGGDIAFDTDANSFDDIIKVASTGSVISNGGNISFDNNGSSGGFIDVYGAVNSGTGNTTFNGRQNRLFNGSTVTANELTFTGSIVDQKSGSTIVTETLKGALAATASFLGLNNDIASVGDFATGTANWSTGGFTLVDNANRRLNINGTVSTTGGNIDITNANRMDVRSSGALLSAGGNITLNATNNSFLYGDGLIDARGASSTGDVAMNAGSTVVLRTGQVFADDLSFTGKTVSQETPSTIIARNLTGSLEKAATFLGAANDIDFIGDFTTGLSPFADGGFTLHDVDGFEVTGAVTSTGGDITFETDANSFDDIVKVAATGSVISNGGNISFDNNGSSGGFIDVYGNVDSGTGDTSFNGRQNRLFNGSTVTADDLTFTGSSVDQKSGSVITVNTLHGSLAAAANFRGTGNDIGTLANFATGTANWSTGGLTLDDTNGLNITGPVSSTGGDIDIFSNGDIWSEGIILSGSLTSQGGDVRLANNKGNVIVTNSGVLNADMGDVDFISNGSDIQLQGNAQVTGGTVHFEGGQVTQSANSILTAKKLTGTIQKFANFDGVNNAIDAIGEFAVGLASWYNDANGFRVYDNDGINIMGPVSSTGGDIDIFSDGSIWSEGTLLSGSLTSQGGDVRLANNKGNVIVTNSGNLNADMGNVDFFSNGSDIQLQGNAQVTGDRVNFFGGQLTQSTNSVLTAGKLTGALDKFAHLDGTHNAIDELGNFAVGRASWYNDANGFRLANATDLNVTGTVSTTGGPISIFNDGDFAVANLGKLLSDGGDIDVTTSTGHDQDIAGILDARGLIGKGNINLDSGAEINFNGFGQVFANTLQLDADTDISESLFATIEADYLTGTSGGTTTLFSFANNIGELGSFVTGDPASSAGGFTLLDNDGLLVSGPVTSQGGAILIGNLASDTSEKLVVTWDILSNGGLIGLGSLGSNVLIKGRSNVDAGAGDIYLATDKTVQLRGRSTVSGDNVTFLANRVIQNANSILTAGTLSGLVGRFAHFDGLNNAVSAIGDFVTGVFTSNPLKKDFRLNNTVDLAFTGDLNTNGGDINIVNNGNILMSSGSADALGGNIDIFQTGTFASLTNDTVRTTGTGTINLVQRDGGSLNSIVGAVENTGTGLNTVTVDAGTYSGQVDILEDNFLLIGANAGIAGQDVRGPESFVTAPGASAFFIGGDNIVVDGFQFGDSATGVRLEGADNVLITNSRFTNNTRGVFAAGGAAATPPAITVLAAPENNGYIALSANQFTNNQVAAEFESGEIDLTGAPNDYIGGRIALRFAPFALGGGNFAPLSLVDDTIGFGFFSGQTEYFVQLANGAFFAPGSPTVLNGLDATYVTSAGTFRPRDSLPLTAEQQNFLEQRFFHFTDDGSLGLFFFGQNTDLDEEDFLRTYGQFIAQNGPLSLTIRGLPFVDQSQFRTVGNGFGGAGNARGPAGFSAADFANIAPAAGGEGGEDFGGENFAAEDLANLEPAAGGEDVTCWGDALNGAFNGTTVNFNFGSGADAFSSASSCSSGAF